MNPFKHITSAFVFVANMQFEPWNLIPKKSSPKQLGLFGGNPRMGLDVRFELTFIVYVGKKKLI
jgi:hypothetical protein